MIGPADAQGRRPVYFVTGDGMLHIVNAADGTDLQPPYKFYGGKGWALNLVGNTLWMADHLRRRVDRGGAASTIPSTR